MSGGQVMHLVTGVVATTLANYAFAEPLGLLSFGQSWAASTLVCLAFYLLSQAADR